MFPGSGPNDDGLVINEIDIGALYKRVGAEERKLVRDLLETDQPRQALVLAELLHYFPGSKLVPEPEPSREGSPLTEVVADMFPELENT